MVPASGQTEQALLLDTIQLLAALFRGPDASVCEGLLVQGVPLLASDAAGSELPELSFSLNELAGLLPDPTEAGDFCDQIESAYVRLFVNAPGGVAAPLYESCYISGERQVMGPSAVAMRQRLAEAGLEPELPGNEPEDHLCIELEYLYFLLSSSDSYASGTVFAVETLLPWCEPFAEAVAKADPDGVFACASRLLVTALKSVS